MGHIVRVFHVGSQVIGREHRRDEFETGNPKNPGPGFGAAAYTDVKPYKLIRNQQGQAVDLSGNLVNEALVDWFLQDEDVEYPAGEAKVDANWMPLEVWSCPNPQAPRNQRVCAFDGVKLAAIREKRKNRAVGAGGRIDALRAKLVADTITEGEIREMLRLERNL